MRLEGKVAFISGGARGLGEADVRRFVQEGARVAFGDILEEAGRALESELRGNGAQILFTPLDVTSEKQWERALQATVENFGRLDILVNNAATGGPGSIEDTTRTFWDRIMAVNLTGVFLGTKVAIPWMRETGGGSIVNISSQMGITASTNSNVVYQTSKGAVRMFSKAAAIQHADDNIRVNSVHPGPIATEKMLAGISENPDQGRYLVDRVPIGRLGTPEEVANGVLFLASDESSFITGTELLIDGGWVAQ
jgi:NAD(P)-dependent dehydrogenase (short-subunit alcohol dehydrogenase family)